LEHQLVSGKESRKEARRRWLLLVAGAALCGRDHAHHLVDVLSAARPGRLAALFAGDRMAHGGTPSLVLLLIIPLGVSLFR
ncbi:hypothetical protein, partial [Salinibacterium sp.]|uniref:hypothetical protein n=1 Tax=Salinibacterium sp. TaxID=1915057 RepID=UPI00286C2CFD